MENEALYRELSKHHMTRGIQVASGVTCECGYWNGDEQPGKDRPVGFRGDGLDWHRTQVVAEFLDANMFSAEKLTRVAISTPYSLQDIIQFVKLLKEGW